MSSQASAHSVAIRTADKRVKFTNELLQGIRLIKLFAWEESLMGQLHAKREAEIKQIKFNSLLGGVMGFFFTSVSSSPFVARDLSRPHFPREGLEAILP